MINDTDKPSILNELTKKFNYYYDLAEKNILNTNKFRDYNRMSIHYQIMISFIERGLI